MSNNLNAGYRNEWLHKMASVCEASSTIDSTLYEKYEVKRGLRDLNGRGVLTGLTEISEIQSTKISDGVQVPCDGKLFYQGIDIEEIVDGFLSEKRFGYEEVVYLLIFGKLPNESELEELKDMLANYRQSLPTSFVRDIIMKAPSVDLMNTLGRSVLTLYSYDDRADDITTENVLRQCLQLVALFPMFAVYGYQAACYFHEGTSFFLHHLLLLRLKIGLPQMQLFPQQAVAGIEDEIDAITGEVLLQILERFQIGAFLMGQACQHFHVLFIPDNEECEQPNQRLFMVDAKDAVSVGAFDRPDQIALKLFFAAQHGV